MPALDLWVLFAFLYCWLLSIPKSFDMRSSRAADVYRQGVVCAMMAGAMFFYYQGLVGIKDQFFLYYFLLHYFQ